MNTIALSRAAGRLLPTLLGLALSASAAVAADKYPIRPINLFSPLPTGGSTDVATRAWMSCVSQDKLAGQPIVLLNRPGANGVVAASAMRQQPTDGYSLMVAGMSQTTITPFIFKKQPYDPEKDFEGAVIFGTTPFMMVASTGSGIRSLKELQAFAKASGKGIDLGIPAIATPAHLMSAAIAEKLGVNATLVPQGSEPQGVAGLIGGQIHAMIFVAGSVAPHVEAGKVVPLMTFTEQRLPQFPNVPTVVEAMGDNSFARTAWIGITTKAGSPKEVVKSVESWTKTCLEGGEFPQALRNALFTPRFISAAEYADIVRKDIAFWRPWITKLGISND